MKAEQDLAKTEIERDAALAVLAMQREAEPAQRARVDDAFAIKASAGFTIVTGGVDLNGDGRYDPAGVPGEILPAGGSSTYTVANYQGAQDRLLNLPAESLSVRAFRSRSLVSVSATVRQGGDRKQLFRVSSGTVAEDTTSIAEQVRVPGGHTNYIWPAFADAGIKAEPRAACQHQLGGPVHSALRSLPVFSCHHFRAHFGLRDSCSVDYTLRAALPYCIRCGRQQQRGSQRPAGGVCSGHRWNVLHRGQRFRRTRYVQGRRGRVRRYDMTRSGQGSQGGG